MADYCFYGTKVQSDTDLFDGSQPGSAEPLGGSQSLVLQELTDDLVFSPVPRKQLLYSAHGRELWFHSSEISSRLNSGQLYRFEVEGVVDFSFIGGGSTVHYRILQKGSRDLMAFWLIHTFLPMYLASDHGYDFIHASSVEVDAKSILFLAPSTGGKSTLGAYFLRQGHPMISDDKLAIFERGGRFCAAPSHPYHRPFREFEVLGQPIEHPATETRPVHAIYVLERADPESPTEISEIRGLRKFEQLMPYYLFHFPYQQHQRTRWVAGLAGQCPTFRVRRPWNLDRMHEVYGAICAHSRQLSLN